LKAVEGRIRSLYPFQLQEKDGAVIMERKDEDMYACQITANYLLGTIKASTGPPDAPTYAVLDLGGALSFAS
jgi:guanosine-diphosphatase